MPRHLQLEIDRARALHAGQRRATERNQRLLQFRRCPAGILQLDDGLHFLAVFRIGDAEYRDVLDVGMQCQPVLDLGGIDVDAAGDDHVRAAVGKIEIAFGIEITDVADAGPALRAARARGLVRIVVIDELRTVEEHIADLAWLQLMVGLVQDMQRADAGAADRAAMGEPVGGGNTGRAIALGAGVIFPDDRAPPVDHALFDLRRAGRGGVDGAAMRRQVMSGTDIAGQRQQAKEHGRHPLAVGDAIGRDGFEGGLGRELWHHDHGTAGFQRAHGEAQRGSVIQRRGREIGGGLVEAEIVAHPVARRLRRGDGSEQRLLDALGLAGGAGGVEEILADGAVRDVEVAVEARELVRVVEAAAAAAVAADHEHRAAPGIVLLQRCDDPREPRGDEQHLRAAVAHDVGGFLRGQVGADGSVIDAMPSCAPHQLEICEIVVQHDGDAVAMGEPHPHQQLRHRIRALVQGTIGCRLIGEGDPCRDLVGMKVRPCAQCRHVAPADVAERDRSGLARKYRSRARGLE